MIVAHYLIREIFKPFLVILGICIALFGSYGIADFLSDAANGMLATDTIAWLIGLRVLIALEVLIPVSLYVSIVLAFGKLHGTSEFLALSALRVTPAMVIRAVLKLAGSLALVVAILSVAVRPWAYDHLHALSRRAGLTLNVDALRGGIFYITQPGDRVIFLARRQGDGPARDVFVVRRNKPGYIEVISARLAYAFGNVSDDGLHYDYIRMEHAHVYEIARQRNLSDRIIDMDAATEDPDAHQVDPPGYSAVATPTWQLTDTLTPENVAELEWRLSTPFTTILLAILAVPLSRGQPRQNRYGKLGIAIGIYFVYYLFYTTARTWVQHGVVGAFPGIWWVPGLLAAFAAFALNNFRLPRFSGKQK